MVRAGLVAALAVGSWSAALPVRAPLAAQEPPPRMSDPAERAAAEASPLFASHEPLVLTLVADFEALDDDREQESEERPAVLRWTGEGGGGETEIEVRTRGNFRLKRSTCRFPPIRLDFPRSRVEGTVFEGQDKVKLVTHCQDRDDYEQNLLEEYLVYRTYNLLTEASFRARLARITYEQVDGSRDPVTRYAILLEHEDAMAARIGGVLLEMEQLHPALFDGPESVRMALFQFMVGNTDFSSVYFHNVVGVLLDDGRYYGVPYDFDWTGMVNARYARPDERLDLRNVRQRRYRGFCREEVALEPILEEFRGRRAEVEALYRGQEGLGEDERKKALEYLEEFWEVLDSERRVRRDIEDRCLRW